MSGSDCGGEAPDPELCPKCASNKERRAIAYDALDEINTILWRHDLTDPQKTDMIGAIVANGPLDTAPGGKREDECERLRARIRELEASCGGTGHTPTKDGEPT